MGKNKKGSSFVKFLHGEKGQRFFNFAYSIGAAIVIWGALFKILHLEGGNALLCIGMGTEIAMFILTAFDKPAKEYAWEEVFPALDKKRKLQADMTPEELEALENGEYETEYDSEGQPIAGGFYGGGGGGGTVVIGGGGGGTGGGTVIIGGGGAQGASADEAEYEAGSPAASTGRINLPSAGVAMQQAGLPGGIQLSEEDTTSLRESIGKMSAAADQLSQMAELTTATQDYLSRMSGIAEQMTMLQETTAELNRVSSVLLDSYRAITDNSSNISENSNGYVESMADLNRNIGGLNTIYEIQLKSISSQLESIDRVNRGLKDIRDMYEKSAQQSSRYCEETEKMARYMKQLNSVYEKMITAMTINMYNPMMGGQNAAQADFNPFKENGNQDNSQNS